MTSALSHRPLTTVWTGKVEVFRCRDILMAYGLESKSLHLLGRQANKGDTI